MKICFLDSVNVPYTSKDIYSNKIRGAENILINLSTEFSKLNHEVTIYNNCNNNIKLDVQGAELKVLDGLKENINFFEVIILEVSLHNYNKNSPLFDRVMIYMTEKGFKLFDLFDLKRLGNDESFLIQFDCIFVRNDSNLLNVKF
jgi:hypothetical protein